MALDERFIETKALQALREAKSWDFSQVLRMDKCRGFFKRYFWLGGKDTDTA